MSAVTLGEDLVHYQVLGRGRPVILVHGWIGSWRYWVPTMQQIGSKYRVYALDLFGFGDSSKNSQRYSIEQQTVLLKQFMENLGIGKAALIGHALGAMIVSEFVTKPENKDKVPRMLLVSAPLFDPGGLDSRNKPRALTDNRARVEPAPLPVPPRPTTVSPTDVTIPSVSEAMRKALEEAARNRANGGEMPARMISNLESQHVAGKDIEGKGQKNPLKEQLGSSGLEAMLGKCFRRNEDTYDKLMVDVGKTDKEVLPATTQNFDAGRLIDQLRGLQIPAVLVHGRDDTLLPEPNENLLNYLTHDRDDTLLPILLDGVRHFPMLEHERFVRLVTDFLDTPDVSKLEIKERWRRRTR